MKRTLIIVAVVLSTFIVVGGFAFAFGTPQAPDVAAPAPASGAPAQSSAAPSGADGQPAEVPAPDPNAPLAIEIPGCVCHSDDPKIVEEHSKYRMNQCAGCHAGETPTGMQ